MKHNAKKILSLLLSFVLVLSLVPAAAAGGIPDGEDIDKLIYELYNLAYEKYAEDYEAHNELLNAQDALFVAYVIQAHEVVTDEVVAAYNAALAVYLKYTATVAVTGVTIKQGESAVSEITLDKDATTALTAVVDPDNATDKTVTWTTSDSNVATVANGVVTAQGVGTATITATATNGTADTADDKTATCTVKVNAAAYTVTYDANGGSGNMDPTTVARTPEGKYPYTVESCGFTAPDGKTFDFWKGSDDKEYRVGGEYELTGDLTLTAQWKEEKKPDSGEKKTSGGGSGFDLVFNIPGEDNSWGYGGGYAPQQAYRVSLAPMQGGSAALGLTTGESTETAMNVYPTTTVYVFPNAEQGYVLDKIVWSLIDGSASYDITEAKNFVMPAMDVVVYVTFKPAA